MADSGAVVAADQLEALVAGYADPAFDLAHRLGLPDPAAAEALAAAAGDVAHELAELPPEPPDAAAGDGAEPLTDAAAVLGRWFAAIERRGSGDAPLHLGGGHPAPAVDATTLTAVLLRDRYELPLVATAAAVSGSTDATARLLADGRLAVFSAATGREPPEPGADGDALADPGLLAQFVDGSAVPHRALAVRRHVAGCPDCADTVDAQRLARRIVAAEPVSALDEERRAALLERVRETALAVLPETADIVAWSDDDEPAPSGTSLPALVAVALVLLALAAGLLVGALAA